MTEIIHAKIYILNWAAKRTIYTTLLDYDHKYTGEVSVEQTQFKKYKRYFQS